MSELRKIKKQYESLNCRIEKRVADLLEAYCAMTGLSKTKAVEFAIEEYTSVHGNMRSEITGS